MKHQKIAGGEWRVKFDAYFNKYPSMGLHYFDKQD
jgi:hypothetical protein